MEDNNSVRGEDHGESIVFQKRFLFERKGKVIPYRRDEDGKGMGTDSGKFSQSRKYFFFLKSDRR